MKEITLIAVILILIPAFAYGAVTCSPCTLDSCSCTITDCSSGKLLVYPGSSCSGVPSDKPSFSSGPAVWYPTSYGIYCLKPFCDDSSIVPSTNSVNIASPSPGVSTTTTTQPSGPGANCRAVAHVCTAASLCCPGLQCVNGICQAPLTVSTTPATATSIAVQTRRNCPYDCCVGEDNFYDKPCDEGYECVDNSCQESTATTVTTGGNGFSWALLIPIIVIIVLVPLFIFFFVFKRKQDDWKKLYEKWKRPKTSYR
jgi:hypothetical protein